MRPPGAFAYRAGHLWEQALLPAAARQARVIYCPANLAPAASSRTVVVINDLAALRHPELVLAGLRVLPAADPAAAGAPRPARDRPLGVLAARARRGPRRSTPSASRSCRTAWTSRFSPVGRPGAGRGAPTGSSSPTCSWSAPASRARTSPSLADGRARGCASRASSWSRPGSGRAYMRPGETPPMRALGYVRRRRPARASTPARSR